MKYASSGIHHASSYFDQPPPMNPRSPRSNSGGSSSGRPPSQVFTRGNIGAVKIQRQQSFTGSSNSSIPHLFQSRSKSKSPRRARSKTPVYSRKSSKSLSQQSNGDNSSYHNGYSSEGSQASGYHSAPSTSSRRKVTSVLKELGLKAPSASSRRDRESSPSQSDDQKQHIRQVRKDLEGMYQ
jgi:hypothetical protein